MYVSHCVTEIEQCCIFIRVFFYLLCIKHFYCFYKVRGCVVSLVGHGSCIMVYGSVFVWVSGSWPATHCLLCFAGAARRLPAAPHTPQTFSKSFWFKQVVCFADNTATFFNFYIDFSHLRAGYIESTVFQPAPSRVSTCTSTCFLLFVTDRKLKSSDKHFISYANPKSRNRGKPVWDCSDNDTDVYTPAWWTWFTRRPLRVTIRYDTIRDAILTCARKPT